jgi:hypothetical protein
MTHLRAGLVLSVLGLSLCVSAQSAQKAAPMTNARGTFDVKLNPQPTDSGLGRMSIDKQFHGDLEAVSKGEMLAAGTAVKDSAGYVAMEKVAGTLHGKKGEFILQHSGTMNRGAQSLALAVVPDSGTGELVGLSGTMSIDIKDGKHFYTFSYAIAKAP